MALTQISTQGIKDGTITNADIGASAAIAGSKISPTFTSSISTTGNITTNGDIFVSSAYPRIHLTDTDNNSDYIFVNDNGNFRIFDSTNNTARFTVEGNGTTRVAGNLDALAGIDVTGTINATSAATFNSVFATTNNTTRATIELNGKDGSGNEVELRLGGFGDTVRGEIFTVTNHSLGFATNNAATQMVLDTSGNLGIGTTSPSQPLHVEQSTVNKGLLAYNTNTTSNASVPLFLASESGGSTTNISIENLGAGNIGFRTGATTKDGYGSERMRIDSAGKVGIGTTSPSHKVHIKDSSANPLLMVERDSGATSFIEAQTDKGVFGTGNNHPVYFLQNSGTAMVINTSKNVGIGVLNPLYPLHVKGTVSQSAPADFGVFMGLSSNDDYAQIQLNGDTGAFIDFSTSGVDQKGRIIYTHGTNTMEFYTNSGGQARIDGNGKFLVGTSDATGKIHARGNTASSSNFTGSVFTPSGDQYIHVSNANTGGSEQAGLVLNASGSASAIANIFIEKTNSYVGSLNLRMRNGVSTNQLIKVIQSNGETQHFYGSGVTVKEIYHWSNNTTGMSFRSANTQRGNIYFFDSGVQFNTNSDYRLKENVTSISDGITRIKQLIPRKFNWIIDESNTPVDGFLAHEVSSIVPEAINGTKDAVATQEDVDSHLAEKIGDPIHQMIDHSKIVPLVVAALKEAISKIEILETEVAALKAS